MEAAKRGRDVAAREVYEGIRQAEKYLSSTNPSVRLLKQRMSKVDQRVERLRECHYTYCEKAKIPVDNEDAIKYLSEITDAALDCTDECAIFVEEKEIDAEITKKRLTETEEKSKQRQEKIALARQVSADTAVKEEFALALTTKLRAVLSGDEKTDEVIALEKLYDDKLCETVDNLNKAWKVQISRTVDEEELERAKERISKMKMEYQDAHSQAASVVESHFAIREREKNNGGRSSYSNTSEMDTGTSNTSGAASFIKPEKMKLPSFSGNIRNFARFKKDFKEIVLPFYPEEIHQLYVIKENCRRGKQRH